MFIEKNVKMFYTQHYIEWLQEATMSGHLIYRFKLHNLVLISDRWRYL